MAKKNSRNTKGRIIQAAWQLFYQQGYDDTTVEEIIQMNDLDGDEVSSGTPLLLVKKVEE